MIMNKRAKYIPALIALTALFSCTKELSYENNGRIPGAGTFTAVIDGVQWAATDSGKAASIMDGMINISGLSADNKQLNITLNDTATGTYKLNQNTFSLASFSAVDSSGIFAFTTNEGSDSTQAGGTVTVTRIDRVYQNISGTFSFNMYRDFDGRQKQVRQGVFTNIPYTSLQASSTGTDTMRATIDGSAWAAQAINGTALSGILTISGSHSDGTLATILVMPQGVTPGSWTLDINGGQFIGLYDPTPTIVMASSGGILQILENNQVTKRIRGNFQFQATVPLGAATARTDQVTSGYFSVQYH
jgi:hypothetical protein